MGVDAVPPTPRQQPPPQKNHAGLSHARIWGNSNEYSDQTDPMGGGNFGCYNAPHSYQLGWQAPSVVGANNLPVGGVLSRTISAPSRINASPINTGVLVNVKSWNSGGMGGGV